MRTFLALLVAVCCSGCGGCVHDSSGSAGGGESTTSTTAEPLVPGVAVGQGTPRVMRINPSLLGLRPDAAAPAPSGSAAPPGAQE